MYERRSRALLSWSATTLSLLDDESSDHLHAKPTAPIRSTDTTHRVKASPPVDADTPRPTTAFLSIPNKDIRDSHLLKRDASASSRLTARHHLFTDRIVSLPGPRNFPLSSSSRQEPQPGTQYRRHRLRQWHSGPQRRLPVRSPKMGHLVCLIPARPGTK